MKKFKFPILLLFCLIFTILQSCDKESSVFEPKISPKSSAKTGAEIVYKGNVEQFKNGKVRSWYQEDDNSKPMRIALSIDDDAMNSLDENEESVVINLNPKAEATPFKHIWMNWNPHGHPPLGVYNVPHFDFHFYEISSAERQTFVDLALMDISPDPDYIPAGHLGVDPVPQMGKHFIDLSSPEFNGGSFTQTFIYGSNNKKVIFMEPMITVAFLNATTGYTRSIPQPAKYQKSGYYPTIMSITKSPGITNIILEGFVYRTES